MKNQTIYNNLGKPVLLNSKEKRLADIHQKIINSLGYEINITTLTTIMKRISEQKFYQIPFADYLPVRVGEGAWSSNLLTYRSYSLSGKFEEGILNLGSNNSRLATADTGVDGVSIQVFNWAKSCSWNIMDLEIAAKAGNWDIVTSKEVSRKKNWDLGVQEVAFIGTNNGTNSQCVGLLNQSGITTNSTLITTPISQMTPSQFKTFTAQLIELYRFNCNRTAWPNRFVVPESDYNGMATQISPDFPIKSVLEILQDTLRIITRNKDFMVLPLAYADGPYGIYQNLPTSQQFQIYSLYNADEESLRMDIPVDYTNSLANSIDNFMFQNTGYGQFSGALAYRPLEMMYFTLPTSSAVI